MVVAVFVMEHLHLVITHKKSQPRFVDVVEQIFELPSMTIEGDHLECTPMGKPIWERTSFFFCKTVFLHNILNITKMEKEFTSFSICYFRAHGWIRTNDDKSVLQTDGFDHSPTCACFCSPIRIRTRIYWSVASRSIR